MEKRLLFFNSRHLFTRYYFLDIIKLVEGFEGREVIHVEAEDFITDLAEDGVIKLEERELYTFARGGDFCGGLTNGAYLGILGL